MASVISSEVFSDRSQANGMRYLRYRYVLEDNNGVQREVITQNKRVSAGFDEVADLAATGTVMLDRMASQEIAWMIEVCREGGDPLHQDVGFWEKITPDWNTWDEAATAVLKYFLSQDSQLELQYISDTLGRMSNTDIRNLLGVTNQEVSDIQGEVQVGVNTQTSLDLYGKWFEDGVKVR